MTPPVSLDPDLLAPSTWAAHTPTEARGEAWRQAHHAARLVSVVAGLWGTLQRGNLHLSLRWHTGARALVGPEIRGTGTNFRVGLRFADPAFLLCDASFATLQHFELIGRKMTEARGWLFERAEKLAGGPARNDTVQLPRLDLHPIEEGGLFGENCSDGFRTVGRAYANAHHTLGLLRTELDQHEAPILCWPEHLDLSCTFFCDPAEESAGRVHVGLSPGGDRRERAYWFAQPLPERSGAEPVALQHGQWVTKGPLVAVLDHDEVTRLSGAPAQAKRVAQFFAESVPACEAVLAGA